jgi:deoxyribodipyrimidine photo-lyase
MDARKSQEVTSVLTKRIRQLNEIETQKGPVVYWMSRDQRVEDNWGLIYAQAEAVALKAPLFVVFTWMEDFLSAQSRHYAFMARGLIEVLQSLQRLNIPFNVIEGDPCKVIPEYLKRQKAGMLIADAHVLRECREWKRDVADRIKIAFHEVDTHNIIPVWEASPKAEYGAYTIRPKIKRQLEDYLIEFPVLEKHPFNHNDDSGENAALQKNSLWLLEKYSKGCKRNAGSKAAWSQLLDFIEFRLPEYHRRNDPNIDAASGLSPYLHFGQISAQRVALEINKRQHVNKAEFLEELIVRRELADNFCYYNENYDTVKGFPRWARESLAARTEDLREYIYNVDDLESGETHDPLWNAAQTEMVVFGCMPGYLRMYWAKKILEWSVSPEQAMATAITLNNSYFLDGRDPNGYTGIAWSIGGVHDRPWAERRIFGKIRYMSYNGARRKFNVSQYIQGVAERTGVPIPGDPVDKKKKI